MQQAWKLAEIIGRTRAALERLGIAECHIGRMYGTATGINASFLAPGKIGLKAIEVNIGRHWRDDTIEKVLRERIDAARLAATE